MTGKNSRLIIGDLHGCYDEAVEILKLSGFLEDGREVFFAGDLVHRGPKSKECFELFRSLNSRAVLGNHELEHLMLARGEWKDSPRAQNLRSEFGKKLYNEFLEEISSWPLYIDEPDFLLVHAGIEPGKTAQESSAASLTALRTVPDPANSAIEKPWFDFYSGEKPVIFGHWSRLGGVVRENVIGLDLGCVYGKALRAVVMPERKIIEFPAFKQYYNPS